MTLETLLHSDDHGLLLHSDDHGLLLHSDDHGIPPPFWWSWTPSSILMTMDPSSILFSNGYYTRNDGGIKAENLMGQLGLAQRLGRSFSPWRGRVEQNRPISERCPTVCGHEQGLLVGGGGRRGRGRVMAGECRQTYRWISLRAKSHARLSSPRPRSCHPDQPAPFLFMADGSTTPPRILRNRNASNRCAQKSLFRLRGAMN